MDNILYVYLFRSTFTHKHIDMMDTMIDALEEARYIDIEQKIVRDDLDAVEYKINASTHGMEFLNHMDECDMIQVVANPF